MFDQQFTTMPNTGRLMVSVDKKHDKSPDFWGSISFDPAMLVDLLQNRTDDLIEIKISGWKTTSKAGNSYLSLKVNAAIPQSAPKATASKDPWEI